MKRLLGSLRSGISSHKSKFSNQSIYLPHFFNNIRSVSTQSTIFSSLKNNETMDPSSELKEDTTTTPSINNSNDENPNVAFDETVSQPATKSEEKTKIDSTNKVNTIASTMTTTRDFRIKSIQSELVSSHNSGKVSRIFELLEVVRNEGIRLNTKSYMIFLWACTRVTGSRANQAYWAFGCLRKDGILPLDAFDKVLTVCANQADLRSAIDILKEFKVAYANIPLRSLNIALPLLLSQKNQSQKHFTRLRAECDNWVDTLYDELKKSRVDKDMSRLSLAVRTEKDESLMESIYIGLALFYVTRNKSVRAIDVLETMVQDGHTPTFQLCEKLLDAALDSSNIKVAILLISWFGSTLAPTAEALKTGQAKRLSYEKIRRVLLLAFKDKVPSLVDPTYQLFTAHGYAVSPLDFALCARIHINARGVIDALEYFFAAEEAGVDLLRLSPEEVMEANTYVPDDELEGGDEGLSGLDDEVRGLDKVSSKKCTSTKKLEESSRSSSLGRRLQIEICDAFEFKLKELDELYFALLDLVRMGRRIPMVVLNGLIMSVGRHGQMDRAFATFEELPTVFGREPDVFTFNSLLYAICVSINPRISYMVPIFEEMESRGVQPDAFSFSYLMLTMADTAELDGFCDLLTFMESKGTLPSPNSLRRVAITLARHGHWESCKKCLAALATYEDQTPRFFLRRIQYFRKKHGLPVDPTLPSFIGIIPSIASK